VIRIQREAFDTGAEIARIKAGQSGIGGTAVFLGTVREMADGHRLERMTLEHYPGMTEAALAEIEQEAKRRWPLADTLIVHRYGELGPGDDIVLVVACSAHRDAAFDACRFLIDWLKTKAPFWKLEEGASGAQWVEAKSCDDDAAGRWG
jgi:molybdopterin synthase catalytic subunit